MALLAGAGAAVSLRGALPWDWRGAEPGRAPRAPSIFSPGVSLMRIDRPTPEQAHQVLRSIIDEVLAPYAHAIRGPVSDRVVQRLVAFPPRQAKRIVNLAVAYAAADERPELSVRDIEAAIALAAQPGRRAIGFHLEP